MVFLLALVFSLGVADPLALAFLLGVAGPLDLAFLLGVALARPLGVARF